MTEDSFTFLMLISSRGTSNFIHEVRNKIESYSIFFSFLNFSQTPRQRLISISGSGVVSTQNQPRRNVTILDMPNTTSTLGGIATRSVNKTNKFKTGILYFSEQQGHLNSIISKASVSISKTINHHLSCTVELGNKELFGRPKIVA